MTDTNKFNFDTALSTYEYHREDVYVTFPDDVPVEYCEACGRPLYVGKTVYKVCKVCKVCICDKCCTVHVLR